MATAQRTYPRPGGGPRLRPSSLATLGLLFAAGACLVWLLPGHPGTGAGWLVLALTLVLWGRARPLAALLLGLGWSLLHAGILLSNPFPETLVRAPLMVEGRIASVPESQGPVRRFLFSVEQSWVEDTASDAGKALLPAGFTGLVRLSWYRDAPPLRAGERWRLPVRLKPRHGFANPGGFDYERWLFAQRVAATGSLRAGPEALRIDAGPGRFWLDRLRQGIGERLAGALGDSRGSALIQALTIGERGGFTPADWEVLSRTGTNHLVAISGLHVGLFAGAAFLAVRALWGLLPGLALAVAAPRAGAVAGLAAAFAYAALAGFAVSTQRALIMLAVVLGAVLAARTLRPWHAFGLAVAGVLVVDPFAPLSYGAWLSFGAVAVLLWSLAGRLPSRDLWSRWGRAQWAVGIGLMPLLLVLFGRGSLIAPLVNLVAVPVFSLVLLPLVLITAFLSLALGLDAPLRWTGDLLGWCLDGLARLADWSWAAFALPEAPVWTGVAALFGVALLLAPRGLPARIPGLVLCLPILILRPPAPAPGEAWLTLLDVGQGLAAVVRTASGTLVYDTGPGYPSGFDTGEAVLLPYLKSRGVGGIDVLVVSHADRDHSGGAESLVAGMRVGRVLGGEPGELGIGRAAPCVAGQGWDWSGVRFRFLYPDAQTLASGVEGNNASCVLRVEAGGRSLLFTGDITATVERRLVDALGDALASDVLVAGHHGSATSSSAELLDAVAPAWVLYAAGYANPFGFPAEQVQARVRARGIETRDTAVDGAVMLRLGPNGRLAGPWTWRERAARPWTHRPARGEPSGP